MDSADGTPETGNWAKPRQRPTLKTIAAMTGLGVTTVSRALKDAPDIGAETKERVRTIARQIGYQPDRAGVRLRTGKTNVIALVLGINEEIMGFTSQMLHGISQGLAGTPYHLVVTPHSHGDDPLQPIRYILDTGSADGVIISRTEPEDERVRLLTGSGLPFVTHGRTAMGIIHPFHDFDNEAYAYGAVERLAARGRRRIALLQPPPTLTFHAHTRSGFEKALRDFGAREIPLPVTIDTPLAEIRDSLAALMRGPEAPDGIISLAASAAIAARAGIEDAGRRLGRDVDMVAKQSADILNWVVPDVIAAREDVPQAGRALARALVARIDGAAAEELQSLSQPEWEDPSP